MYTRKDTMVGIPGGVYREVYQGYIPGCIGRYTRVGVPQGVASLPTMVGIHLLPSHIHPVHPGYTQHPPVLMVLAATCTRRARGAERRSWAHLRRNLWVESLPSLPGPKSVTLLIPVCAELLRSSGENCRKDWIATG